jgi:ABC-type branched-subunit amino acid transport system permease subunit
VCWLHSDKVIIKRMNFVLNSLNLARAHRVATTLLFLLVFPFLMPYDALSVNILLFGLYAVGFNLLFGYTGILSFGHAAFLGVGSYLAGIVMVHFGWPWWLAIVVGVVSSCLAGAVIGYLAIRTRGIYFSMVTLALAQIVYYAFYKAEHWTGGENGLRGVKVEAFDVLGLHIDFLNPLAKYYVILVFVALALWFVSRVLNSPLGAVMEAIRENEKRTVACGYDVARTKLLVFVLSAGICGLAGALRALHLSIVPLLAVGPRGDDGFAGGHGHFLWPVCGGGGVSLLGRRGDQPHALLDGRCGHHLHGVCAVLPQGHLGHGAAPD